MNIDQIVSPSHSLKGTHGDDSSTKEPVNVDSLSNGANINSPPSFPKLAVSNSSAASSSMSGVFDDADMEHFVSKPKITTERTITKVTPAKKRPAPSSENEADARKSKSNPRKRRGYGYSKNECNVLLKLLHKYSPTTHEEWEFVTFQYNQCFVGSEREPHSLRRKFNSIHREKINTNDSSCPSDARAAKRIYKALTDNTKISAIKGDSEADVFKDGESVDDDLVEDALQLSAFHTIAKEVNGNESENEKNKKILSAEEKHYLMSEPVVEKLPSIQNHDCQCGFNKTRTGLQKATLEEMVLEMKEANEASVASMNKYLKFVLLQREEDRKEREQERRWREETLLRFERERTRREEMEREERKQDREEQRNFFKLMMMSMK